MSSMEHKYRKRMLFCLEECFKVERGFIFIGYHGLSVFCLAKAESVYFSSSFLFDLQVPLEH